VLQEVCDLCYGCLRSWVSMLEGLHLLVITFDWVCQIKGGLSYWKMVYGNIHYVMTNVFIFDLVRIMEVILVCYEQFIHCTKIFVMFYDFRVYLSFFIHLKGYFQLFHSYV
jgi:hypothetical protein